VKDADNMTYLMKKQSEAHLKKLFFEPRSLLLGCLIPFLLFFASLAAVLGFVVWVGVLVWVD